MKAFVYWNFNKKVFSVRVKGRVIAHATRILMEDVEFKVSEAGRARVLKSGHKNVHAGIYGTVTACDSLRCERSSPLLTWPVCSDTLVQLVQYNGRMVRYDPYEDGFFKTTGDGRPVKSADFVYGYANRLDGKPNVYIRRFS